MLFLDVTNFYFEIEDSDDDLMDEDGTVLEKGQRKFGVCKEERKLPIVQMGLFMLRIIQKRLIDSHVVSVDTDAYWSNGLSAERIQTALNKWKVDKLPDGLYRFMDCNDSDLKLILDAFQVNLPAKLYRKSELKSIKKDIKIFI